MDFYYSSIDDFPLFNWRKCQEKGDYKYTRLNIEEGDEEKDVEAWELIYDSYLAEFGLGKDYERILEIKQRIAIYECDLVITGDNFIKNHIKQLELELKDLLEKPVESDLDTCLIYVSKWLGFPINEKETTVKRFYKYLREYKKEAERLKKR